MRNWEEFIDDEEMAAENDVVNMSDDKFAEYCYKQGQISVIKELTRISKDLVGKIKVI